MLEMLTIIIDFDKIENTGFFAGLSFPAGWRVTPSQWSPGPKLLGADRSVAQLYPIWSDWVQ